MKTSRLTYALIAAGLMAVAVALVKAHVAFNLEVVTGYVMALSLMGFVALEYRVGAKRDVRY